ERIHGEQTASEPRLIAGHHDAPAGAREPGNGIQTARHRLPFVRRLNVGVAVFIDDAVAVRDDELHCARPAISATSFMLRCSLLSKARRLRRTAGSAAMTMTSLKKSSSAPREPACVASDALKSPASYCAWATAASPSIRAATACSADSVQRAGATSPMSA